MRKTKAILDLTLDTITYVDEPIQEDVIPTGPFDAEDFAGATIEEVEAHALGLKAVLEEVGPVAADDPMYGDFAVEYANAKAYLAGHDIIV